MLAKLDTQETGLIVWNLILVLMMKIEEDAMSTPGAHTTAEGITLARAWLYMKVRRQQRMFQTDSRLNIVILKIFLTLNIRGY